tara:strand:- start:3115 stop:3417 length:303 start_codon:yes stop_codon:yes gene_type:complete
MSKYIVTERCRKNKSFAFVNEDTKNLENIWITECPYNLPIEKQSELRPLIFQNRQDALKYKQRQQVLANDDWYELQYTYKMYGDSKPKWVVESYKGNLFE